MVCHVTTIDLSLRYLLLNQLRSIASGGFEVVGVSSAGADVEEIERAGIRHIAVTMSRSAFSPLVDLRALWRLYRLFRRERFVIVHTHTPKPGLLGQIAARLAGVPIVVNTLHGFYFHDGTPALKRRLYVTLEKIAAMCSDVILSQNREDIETAVEERICGADRIRHLGNGIDLSRFDRRRLDAATLRRTRRELDIRDGAPVVGFVGRLVKEKGLLELFAAARVVSERIPDAIFLFVGPADQHKSDVLHADAAEEYGIADRCRFSGFRQDTPELYGVMDVFVLPSHREGFPRAPMEASAMGVPCIATDVRGCRETVFPGRNGLLVKLGDVAALAQAIVELLTDPQRAREMGEAGRLLAADLFDERKVFRRVQDEYRRLLREKGLPAPDRAEPVPLGHLTAHGRP